MIRFIDLFCGIGGFRLGFTEAARNVGLSAKCVFSSDIDEAACRAYEKNFGHKPDGDITKIALSEIPDHDVLLAGFPCQPFSICGDMRGFEDIRGTLFFHVAKIIDEKRPRAVILENVKLLRSHNHGRTLKRILKVLRDLGYHTDHKVLNALDFGLPHKRERIFIVAFRHEVLFDWPQGGMAMKPLSAILESDVPQKYWASAEIQRSRKAAMRTSVSPTIWHENKAGHISAYPYSCALRAGASYNYLLVDGKRRLTPREMLRLQGFPDSYQIVCNYSQTRKQCGNSIAVPVVSAVAQSVLKQLKLAETIIFNPKIETAYDATSH